MRTRTLIGLIILVIVIAAVGVAVWQAAPRPAARLAQAVERDLFGAPIIARDETLPPAQTVPPPAAQLDQTPVRPQQDGQFPGEPVKQFEMPEIKAYA